MSRKIGRAFMLSVAGFAAVNLAACGTAPSGPTWVASSKAPVDVPSAKPTRLARITSACKLLPPSTVIKFLGGTSQTKLTAHEEAVEKRSNGNVWRYCSYDRDGRAPFSLGVGTLPKRADTVKETIDAVAKAGGTSSVRISGLGADAVSYLGDGGRVIMTVVPFGTQLRAVIFTAPKIVPQDKLEDVARHVVKQI